MRWLDTGLHSAWLCVSERVSKLITVAGANLAPGIRGAAPVDDHGVAPVARYQVLLASSPVAPGTRRRKAIDEDEARISRLLA